jgi:hypothetical protein
MSARRTVHIPIVRPGGPIARPGGRAVPGGGDDRGEDRLIEIYTQVGGLEPLSRHEEETALRLDEKARDKDWDRVAAPLRKVGLYQAGCAAASAVRKLGIRRPLTALYQQVSRLAWIEGQRLHAATAQGPTEGRSAELGLALVLLMGGSGTRHRQIIATGALGGQPTGVDQPDIEVLPVASLRDKLRLVLTLARHDALPGRTAGREMLFFTPLSHDEGRGPEPVEALAEVADLADQGVRVRPVGRLAEAAAVLRADRARHLLADRIAAAFLLLLVLGAGAGAAWSAIREDHVSMTFVAAGGGAGAAEPFQACFTADGRYLPTALAKRGLGHRLPAGATLGWQVRVGAPEEDRHGLRRWFAPDAYHLAQVMLSSHSRAKVMVPRSGDGAPVTVTPGGLWSWGWELNGRAESNALVLLARSDAPFDPDLLHADLVARFPAAGGDGDAALDLTAAMNYLAAKAPGSATFVVETVAEEDPCG